MRITLVEGMNLWRTKALTLFRSLITLILILTLTGCAEKAVSQPPSGNLTENAPVLKQISKEITEVSPPTVIQELRQTLEVYQPQVTIVTPNSEEVLQDNTATVRFQVKDLPIFKDSQFDLGPHLHVILDNQPYIAVYDLNQPLVLPDLSPGTHTLRVFASRPWHESFKNEGAYAQTTFHVFTKSDDNNPDPNQPLLTYSRPKGSYGAEPILLDFYLNNAPLHLVAKDNPTDEIADWRIRCTINGESFVLDRWQPVYLKGFKPGKNWVKLEFLDEQGNPVKNVFNSTVRLITYEPKGKDTLSKIIRGELKADDVRAIVDPNYTAKVPTAEPTPSPTTTPTVEETPIEPTPSPTTTPFVEETPSVEPTPFVEETPTVEPTPFVEETPQPQPEVEETPQPQPKVEKPKSGGFFNRFPRREDRIPTPQTPVSPPSLPPTLPEIIQPPHPESTLLPEATPPITPQKEETPRFRKYFQRRANNIPTPEALPEETPEPESTTLPENLPEKIAPEPEKPELQRYFNRNQYPDAAPSPTLPLNQPTLEEQLKGESQE